MSYQVIARKWRPFHFDEVTGQQHVTTPLRNAIESERVPHAILLTGPRGTGKTTLARILACCMNAEGGPTATPSRDDPACVDIHAGRSMDVQEVDAASRTSVDDVREIIESIRYAAAPGKWRIFIVDEVHMLSVPAFNSLLKTLEEPPPRSLFIFCTTNPEKIPFTVVSRCQRYDLRRIATSEVAAKLGEIAEAEGVTISRSSLLAVARAGDGSMRDAQTLLDQLISFGGAEVDDARVAEVLDLTDRRVLLDIAAACIEGDAARALQTARHAWDTGVDARRLGGELLGALRDLVVTAVAPKQQLVEGADSELAEMQKLAAAAEPARLRRMFRALLSEQENLTWAPDPFSVIEMALVRIATMPAGDEVAALLARIDELERRLRDGGGTGGGGAGGASGARSGGGGARAGGSAGAARGASARASADGANESAASAATFDAPAAPQDHARARDDEARSQGMTHAREDVTQSPNARDAATPSQNASATRNTEASSPNTRAAHNAATPSQNANGTTAFARSDDFLRALRELAQRENLALAVALASAEMLELGDAARIGFASPTALGRAEKKRKALEALCTRLLQRDTHIEFVATGAAAAAGEDERARPTRDAATRARHRQTAVNHPAVSAAQEVLGARIVEIRPLGAKGARP